MTTTRYAPLAAARYLLPHEREVITVRQHPAVLLGSIALAAAGVLTAFVCNVISLGGSRYFHDAVWLALFLLVMRAAVKGWTWSACYFVVTSERIMLITGVLT